MNVAGLDNVTRFTKQVRQKYPDTYRKYHDYFSRNPQAAVDFLKREGILEEGVQLGAVATVIAAIIGAAATITATVVGAVSHKRNIKRSKEAQKELIETKTMWSIKQAQAEAAAQRANMEEQDKKTKTLVGVAAAGAFLLTFLAGGN